MEEKALQIMEETPDFTSEEAALSLVPEVIQIPYKKITPEMHDLDDSQLEKVIGPTKVDRMLKIKFWQEIERCQKENRLMIKVINVYNDVCSRPYFYNQFLKDEGRVCYMFRKPHSYADKANELIEFAIGRLRNEALTANIIFQDTGHLDSKAAKFILELIQYLDARTKGAITQKHQVESKSMHVNIDATSTSDKPFDVLAELKNVRAQIEKAKGVALVDGLPEKIKDADLVED